MEESGEYFPLILKHSAHELPQNSHREPEFQSHWKFINAFSLMAGILRGAILFIRHGPGTRKEHLKCRAFAC